MDIPRHKSSISFSLLQAVKEAVPVEGNAAEILIRCLESEGVDLVFGIAGEETLELIEALRQSSARGKIKFIVTRHEQAAGFMAAAVARLTDRPGVFLSTLGPGATNCSTALAHAFLAGAPVLLLTGQKPVRSTKQGLFQVVDVVDHFKAITKFNRSIGDPGLIPFLVRKCIRIARLEKPGPVHLELPEDIAEMHTKGFIYPRHELRRPGPDPVALKRGVELMRSAKSPLICIGCAAARRLRQSTIQKLLDISGLYVVATQMGKGVVDERGPQFLGVAALSSDDLVHLAIESADLILHLGHDTTEKPPFLMRHNEAPVVIHVSYTPAAVDEIYFPHLEIVGDVDAAISGITEELLSQCMGGEGRRTSEKFPAFSSELSAAEGCCDNWDLGVFAAVKTAISEQIIDHRFTKSNNFPMTIQRVVKDVRSILSPSSIICLDTGMFKIWFARQFQSTEPHSVILDNALATMGAGLPYAIAAKLVHPERTVIAVCGDGGFMMNSQELETATRLNLHIVVLVLCDKGYGMIKWKQHKQGLQDFGLEFQNPDFVTYAKAYGARGYRVSSAAQFSEILSLAVHAKSGVHVVEVPISYDSSDEALETELPRLVKDLRMLFKVPISPTAEWTTISGTPIESKGQSPHGEAQAKAPMSAAAHKPPIRSPKLAPVKSHYPLYLGNRPVTVSQTLTVKNKLDGSVIATVSMAGPETVKEAIALAVKAQPAMERLGGFERKKILKHCVRRFRQREEELSVVLALEGGKPLRDARAEVQRMVETFEIASEECTRIIGEFQSMDYSERGAHTEQVTRRFPIGPIAMVSPFNFPLNLVAHKIAPALAVGCSFVLKPASHTPIGALIIAEILAECKELPIGAFSVLPTNRAAADLLVTSEHMKMLSFTGSPSVGWDLKARAGKKKVILELGGNAACIVDSVPSGPAEYSRFLERLVLGGFHQAGQSCIHLQRLLVRRDLYKQVVNGVLGKVRELVTGDPLDEETTVGPVISEEEAVRIASWVNAAVEAGGRKLIGGDRQGSLYPPTVLENVPWEAKVWAEEIFGPVLCAAPYDDFASAVDLVNASRFGIHAGMFTEDINKIMYAWRKLEVGGVVVNDVPSIRIDAMPYGGVKDSGIGREGVKYAMEEMSEIRVLLLRQVEDLK